MLKRSETYNLLFLNKTGMEALGIDKKEQLEGRKCYEVWIRRTEGCIGIRSSITREKTEWIHNNNF